MQSQISAPTLFDVNFRQNSVPTVDVIAFALNAEERGLFFPAAHQVPDFAGAQHWLTAEEMAADQWEATMEALNPDVLVTCWGSPAIPADCWARATPWKLRYVCHVTGTVRRIIPRTLLENGLLASQWSSLVATEVAEHALLLILSCLRDVPAWRPTIMKAPEQRAKYEIPARSLYGKRVCLHGFGNVARSLVDLLQPFGVQIMAYSTGVPKEDFTARSVIEAENLQDLFSEADVLVECEALTPATRGMVTESLLQQLPDGAVFINVARGALLEEDALYKLAREGRLRVGLDVVCGEPLRPESRWMQLPNVMISPHIASPTMETFPKLGEYALQNIARYLAGGDVHSRVTLESYDRST